jgi:hypothetical protein
MSTCFKGPDTHDLKCDQGLQLSAILQASLEQIAPQGTHTDGFMGIRSK